MSEARRAIIVQLIITLQKPHHTVSKSALWQHSATVAELRNSKFRDDSEAVLGAVPWQNFTDTRCESSDPSLTDGGLFSWMKCQDSGFWVQITKPCLTGLRLWQEICFAHAENPLLTYKLFNQRNQRYTCSIERAGPIPKGRNRDEKDPHLLGLLVFVRSANDRAIIGRSRRPINYDCTEGLCWRCLGAMGSRFSAARKLSAQWWMSLCERTWKTESCR
jgi:hypothetical protein